MDDKVLAELLVKAAVDLIEGNRVNGDENLASQMLWKAVHLDESNQTAWMWRAKVMKEDEDKIISLEKAIAINSNNDAGRRAKRALERIRQTRTQIPATVDLLKRR
jgi:hypothetical protein